MTGSHSQNDAPANMSWLSRRLLWVDDPSKVNRLIWALVLLCIGLTLADFLYHKHSYFEIEDIPGFYGFYGFIMCAALVIAAKGLRVVLKRDEDYYAPSTVESEEHPEADLGRENVDA